MSAPNAEHELRTRARAGDLEAIDSLIEHLNRSRSDARAWAAVQLAAAPPPVLADVVAPLLRTGPHPSAAAYTLYCATAEQPDAGALLAELVWERALAVVTATDQESRGVVQYGVRLAELLQRRDHPILDQVRLHGDAELLVEAAGLVVAWGLDRSDWADRLAAVTGALADPATIQRLQLGQPVERLVLAIACGGGPWCFAACDALEEVNATSLAAGLLAAGRRRFLVRPYHARLVAAAWALGQGEAITVLRPWLRSRNAQVRAVARAAWLRLSDESTISEALQPPWAPDDAWLLEQLDTSSRQPPSPAIQHWVASLTTAHPDPDCRTLGHRLLARWNSTAG